MEQKSRSIGTDTYLVTQMDAISALRVQTRLIKLLGPAAPALLDTSKPVKEKIQDLVPLLAGSFNEDLVNDLVLALFKKGVFVEVDGHPKVVEFATHFAGKALEMWKVAAFILEVNFDLGELSGLTSPITEKKAELTKES